MLPSVMQFRTFCAGKQVFKDSFVGSIGSWYLNYEGTNLEFRTESET